MSLYLCYHTDIGQVAWPKISETRSVVLNDQNATFEWVATVKFIFHYLE